MRCNIFLGYPSNLISSGLRELILHLVKHKRVACFVTTAGGIEEDFIKYLGSRHLADLYLDGADLRKCGMNSISNPVVPNDNCCKFEDRLTPTLDVMLAEQKASGQVWTLTDGSIGDMIYFHVFRSPGLVMDIVGDIQALNELARTP
jgi:deoxyhypusine synthase